ncbi:unnamed protein product [Ilex paraguariensis]|uniref:Uncharacterized protein n=1 Tax=Ilex paraguariensis TaxID=185542 RepID=A0ABC8R6N1_9AQUA
MSPPQTSPALHHITRRSTSTVINGHFNTSLSPINLAVRTPSGGLPSFSRKSLPENNQDLLSLFHNLDMFCANLFNNSQHSTENLLSRIPDILYYRFYNLDIVCVAVPAFNRKSFSGISYHSLYNLGIFCANLSDCGFQDSQKKKEFDVVEFLVRTKYGLTLVYKRF